MSGALGREKGSRWAAGGSRWAAGAPPAEQRLPQPSAPSTCGCRWQGTAHVCITHCSAVFWVLLCLILGTCWRYSSWWGLRGLLLPSWLSLPRGAAARVGFVLRKASWQQAAGEGSSSLSCKEDPGQHNPTGGLPQERCHCLFFFGSALP